MQINLQKLIKVNKNKNLNNEVAFITGANKGIGFETAEQGSKVIVKNATVIRRANWEIFKRSRRNRLVKDVNNAIFKIIKK